MCKDISLACSPVPDLNVGTRSLHAVLGKIFDGFPHAIHAHHAVAEACEIDHVLGAEPLALSHRSNNQAEATEPREAKGRNSLSSRSPLAVAQYTDIQLSSIEDGGSLNPVALG